MYRNTLIPYFAARSTSFLRLAMRFSEPSPNSGYLGSFASVRRTVWSQTALTPEAESFCRSPSG